MPCGDEVWRLHNLKDPDCEHFQKFCDANGTMNGDGPRATRQGYYCVTPSGILLGSINNRDPGRIARLLRDSLAKWKELSKKERLLDYDPATVVPRINRSETKYPADGLVLRVNSRDLERTGLDQNDWRTHAWNFDYAWFTKDEMMTLLPRSFGKKTTWTLSDNMVRRLSRLHFVDNVRGQTTGFSLESIEKAEITAKVTKIRKSIVSFDMEGEVKQSQNGRGIELKILGKGEYNTKTQKFEKFEIVASGERWGRTDFNRREDDMERSPVGFLVHIASDNPTEKVAPAEFGSYGWR